MSPPISSRRTSRLTARQLALFCAWAGARSRAFVNQLARPPARLIAWSLSHSRSIWLTTFPSKIDRKKERSPLGRYPSSITFRERSCAWKRSCNRRRPFNLPCIRLSTQKSRVNPLCAERKILQLDSLEFIQCIRCDVLAITTHQLEVWSAGMLTGWLLVAAFTQKMTRR